MTDLSNKKGVWFVYDGDCPICHYASEASAIKERYGELHTLNARKQSDIGGIEVDQQDTLIQAINERRLSLDEGMVIYCEGNFYHGRDALVFIAKHGEVTNPFMAFIRALCQFSWSSKIIYPWMRGTRNWLLKRKKVMPIDNLHLKEEPLFKSIFGDSWQALPAVMKAHYANKPYSSDSYKVEGELEIMCKPPLRWFAPIMKLLGQIPIANEKHVPVTVEFNSDLNTKAFHFNRVFYFKDKTPYRFESRMIQRQHNQVIELMRFGLGWCLQFDWDDEKEKVIMSHRGYALKIFGHYIPVPLTLLMGSGYAEEWAVDDNHFEMMTHITHPWWGKMYEYKGRFKILNPYTPTTDAEEG